MSILNWLKSIFGEKKENRTLNVNTDNDVFNSKYNQVHKKEEPRFDKGVTVRKLNRGNLVDLRYGAYLLRDEYDDKFGEILNIQFDIEHFDGKVIDVTRVYYFDVDEHVYYYTGFEPKKVRFHRQYSENRRNSYPGNTRKPVTKPFDPNRSNHRDTSSSSSDDDIITHALLNPVSPMNIWNNDDDSSSHGSSSSHDSGSSSSYDSGGDSGGDCGGGGD